MQFKVEALGLFRVEGNVDALNADEAEDELRDFVAQHIPRNSQFQIIFDEKKDLERINIEHVSD